MPSCQAEGQVTHVWLQWSESSSQCTALPPHVWDCQEKVFLMISFRTFTYYLGPCSPTQLKGQSWPLWLQSTTQSQHFCRQQIYWNFLFSMLQVYVSLGLWKISLRSTWKYLVVSHIHMLKCSLQWQAEWDDSMEKWCYYYYNFIAFLFYFILLENIFISILFSLSLWHCAAFLCSLVMLCKFNYSYRILIMVHIILSHLILTAVLLLGGSAYQTEFNQ